MSEMMTDYEPAKVHIVRDDTRPAGTPAKEKINVVSKTYLAGVTPEMILPRSVKRTHATISVQGTPFVPTSGSAPALNQITLAASGVAAYNNNSTGVLQTISGGTVSAIAINGTATGATSGTFFVPAGGTVTVTYTVAPTTFTTAAVPGTSNVTYGSVILADNQADADSASTYSVTTPQGTVPGCILQPGQSVDVYHNEEVWLARIGTNGSAPLVSVISEYC